MTAVCNIYVITFNVYIMVLACFDEYARAVTLITDSCTGTDNLAPLLFHESFYVCMSFAAKKSCLQINGESKKRKIFEK